MKNEDTNYNSLPVTTLGFSAFIAFGSAFFSLPDQPRAPSLSGNIGCEK